MACNHSMNQDWRAYMNSIKNQDNDSEKFYISKWVYFGFLLFFIMMASLLMNEIAFEDKINSFVVFISTGFLLLLFFGTFLIVRSKVFVCKDRIVYSEGWKEVTIYFNSIESIDIVHGGIVLDLGNNKKKVISTYFEKYPKIYTCILKKIAMV